MTHAAAGHGSCFAVGEDLVAPAVVEVFRLSDRTVVGRIEASSSYDDQARLQGDVRRELETLDAAEFLKRWNIDVLP